MATHKQKTGLTVVGVLCLMLGLGLIGMTLAGSFDEPMRERSQGRDSITELITGTKRDPSVSRTDELDRVARITANRRSLGMMYGVGFAVVGAGLLTWGRLIRPV
jgi:hypothetical protein